MRPRSSSPKRWAGSAVAARKALAGVHQARVSSRSSSCSTLQIIIGSTRPGRGGPAVAEWFTQLARLDGSFDVELVDLAQIGLPLLDEPRHPRLRDYAHDHTRAWSRTVERADAYVFVHPEYNFGINAALKNALDYLMHEWRDKPAGLVSYGGVSGGLRAAQMLKQVVSALGLVVVPTGVTVPFVGEHLDASRCLQATPIMAESARAMLGELARLDQAMRAIRTPAASA
jgi:NAD(P)H-dependent FMN reductase